MILNTQHLTDKINAEKTVNNIFEEQTPRKITIVKPMTDMECHQFTRRLKQFIFDFERNKNII